MVLVLLDTADTHAVHAYPALGSGPVASVNVTAHDEPNTVEPFDEASISVEDVTSTPATVTRLSRAYFTSAADASCRRA